MTGISVEEIVFHTGAAETEPVPVCVRNFFVAEVFTGTPGRYVSIKDTIRGFKGIVEGEFDTVPEQAFYMVGSIDEALEKAKNL